MLYELNSFNRAWVKMLFTCCSRISSGLSVSLTLHKLDFWGDRDQRWGKVREHGVENQAWDMTTGKALTQLLSKQDHSGPITNACILICAAQGAVTSVCSHRFTMS